MDKNNKIPNSFKEYFDQKSVQVEEAQQDMRITQKNEEYIQKLESRLAQCISQEYVDDFRQNCENSGLTIDEYADKLEATIEREMHSNEL